MDVLGFQCFFFVVILLSAVFGKKARNLVCITSALFTLVMVFTNWLLILQFATIIVAFFVTETFVNDSRENLNKLDRKYGDGCITFIVLGGIVAIILKFVADKYLKKEDEPTEMVQWKDTLHRENDSINAMILDSIANIEIETKVNDTLLVFNKSESSPPKNISKEKIIEEFITAENNKDLVVMHEILSGNMLRFWSIYFPKKEEIDEKYYKIWSTYNQTYTQIISIENINEVTFVVKAVFYFDNQQKNTVITFVFGDNNLITEIY